MLIRKQKNTLNLFKKGILSLKNYGIKQTLKKIRFFLIKKKQLSTLTAHIRLTRREKLSQKNTIFSKQIKISIITPLYNTPKRFLIEMIESVMAQTYNNWELCLADGSEKEYDYIKEICEGYIINDKRIIYKKLDKNEGISGNSNRAIEISTGDYFGLLDHDDVLHPSALYEVMKAICYENADFIYTDEAIFKNNKILAKHHKPEFAIDYLHSCNYICHFSVFSKELTKKAGLFRNEFDGSQDYDLILRYTNIASKIIRIPLLLYFWRNHKDSVANDISVKMYAITAGKNAITESLKKREIYAQVEIIKVNSAFYYRVIYDLIEQPLVSIIILNKDNISLLKKCLLSIEEKTTYKNYEIIIVENNSSEDATFAYYEELKHHNNIHIVYWKEKGFNYSILNNFALQYAKGAQLIFLNNDIEIITPNWIEEMLMYSQRYDVGAVGAKLYFPDDTIQHAGILFGYRGTAGNYYSGVLHDNNAYMGKLHLVQNMSAVTAACMMIRRSVFEEVGLFSPEFFESYGDVDLCLKIRRAGYLIVWTPFCEAYHCESKTRGYHDTPEKQLVLDGEMSLFKEKWKHELIAGDPYYNCNFSLDSIDYSLK